MLSYFVPGFKFFEQLVNIRATIEEVWDKEGYKQMKQLTREQRKQYARATTCHICQGKLSSTNNWSFSEYKDLYSGWKKDNSLRWRRKKREMLGPKVRDHNHWTGDFTGAAHALCNLEYYDKKNVSAFFHNGKNYDFHHVVRYLSCYTEEFPQIDVLGQTKVITS